MLLHENATARHLALLRIGVFGMWLADVLKDSPAELAEIPLAYYEPVGVLRWVPTHAWEIALSEPWLHVWWGALVVLLLLSVSGVPCYRGFALVTCALLTFYQGTIFGFSTVTAAPLAALYIAWIVALFPSADALSLRRRPEASPSNEVYQAAILTATILFLSTYMLVGVRRLVDGGVGIFFDGSILRVLAGDPYRPDYLPRSLNLRVLESANLSTMFELGFLIVTCFEVLSLLCLSSKWFRRSWLAVMLPFHVLTWPMLRLLFLHNVLLIGILLVDFEGLAERLGIRRRLGIAPLIRGA